MASNGNLICASQEIIHKSTTFGAHYKCIMHFGGFGLLIYSILGDFTKLDESWLVTGRQIKF